MMQPSASAFRPRPSNAPDATRFVRNVLIAAGNSGDRDLLAKIAPLLDDPSELVRAMAVWAFRRLADPDEVEHMRQTCLNRESAEGRTS